MIIDTKGKKERKKTERQKERKTKGKTDRQKEEEEAQRKVCLLWPKDQGKSCLEIQILR